MRKYPKGFNIPKDERHAPISKKSWRHFEGAKKKAPRPLTVEEEKIRYNLWARWMRWGRKPTIGRWNMAAACARATTAFPRTTAWSRRLQAFKGTNAAKRKYADPVTGKIPFACGFFDQKLASKMGVEKAKALREQREREKAGTKLKHHIPE